eukprot:2830292-Amphidinium_carterae.3
MAEVNLSKALEGFSALDTRHRRITGLNFEEYGVKQDYAYNESIDVVVRPILGDRTGINAVNSSMLFNISKSLTGRGRHAGACLDGWVDLRGSFMGNPTRNVLLAMMQGEKPRYEIRIINNPSGEDMMDDLDIKILAYRILQGHFSLGSDPEKVSTLVKLVAEAPGDTQTRMRYGYHATSLSLRAFDNVQREGLIPGGHSKEGNSIRDLVHMCPLHQTHADAVGI